MRVVYNSFSGRYSDSPRALYESLVTSGRQVEHLWLADPLHAHGFPVGTPTAPAAGPACRAALESADVVISNTHLDLEWDKPAGSLYLQTWHGTPLKQIHFDVLYAAEGLLDRLTLDVRRWDALLSPNPASTGPLRQAFAFGGEVLESGYPRNDVLLSPGRDAVRARVRRELGIADGTPVVLYTPTWRDDLLHADGGPDFALHLDLDDLTARLPGHVLLLRLHYMMSARLPDSERGVGRPGVHDVSFHPDISELYLAADVLVTDYSSTMFDFAVTGKPVVYFPYDLEHYRDDLRGFYFDLFADPPGPVATTSAGVVDALADLDTLSVRHAEAYARFRSTFCGLEDGHATERVLEHFLPQAPRQRTAPGAAETVRT